jgi:FAD/FMN-containing dehydrogenase
MSEEFLSELRSIVGAAGLLTERSEMGAFVTDWTGRFTGSALAVVRPASTPEVAATIKACAARGVALVPQGGNTGLVGGSVPISDRPAVVLSLARMSKVDDVRPGERTLRAEAGAVIDTVNAAAEAHGLRFPLAFGATGSATVGGALSTNAGGANVLRFGNARELCLGLEVVLVDGTVVDTGSGLRKDNTGYDLRDLFIGAEGTLGIITAATLKLFPQAAVRWTGFLSLASLESALAVLNRLRDEAPGDVEMFEYMPAHAVDLVCKHFPNLRAPLAESAETGVLVEIASTSARDAMEENGEPRLNAGIFEVLERLLEDGLVLDAMIAQSGQQRSELISLREHVLESLQAEAAWYHYDIALRLDDVAPFLAAVRARLQAEGLASPSHVIGHLGDGNLHFSVTRDDTLPRVHDVVYGLVREMHGSFSAEHGIGSAKRSDLERYKDTGAYRVFVDLKRSLDPDGLLNPGVMVGPRDSAEAMRVRGLVTLP